MLSPSYFSSGTSGTGGAALHQVLLAATEAVLSSVSQLCVVSATEALLTSCNASRSLSVTGARTFFEGCTAGLDPPFLSEQTHLVPVLQNDMSSSRSSACPFFFLNYRQSLLALTSRRQESRAHSGVVFSGELDS